MKLLCERLLVGVSGSISAVLVPAHIAFLRRALVEHVDVIMTASASKLIGVPAMAACAGTMPFTDAFAPQCDVRIPHIDLPRAADLMVVMPASANIIGKAANGIADDLLSTAILACAAPVVFAPCMNGQMWSNLAVRANVARLRQHGYHVIDPVAGFEVADLQPTQGTMPSLDVIIAGLARILGRG